MLRAGRESGLPELFSNSSSNWAQSDANKGKNKTPSDVSHDFHPEQFQGWESVPVSSREAGPARTHFLWDLQPSQNLVLDGPGEVTVLQNAHFKESHGRRGQEKTEKIWIVQPGKEAPG